MTIPIYEGPLPPAVAKDFEFCTVLTAKGEGRRFTSESYSDHRLIPPSAYNDCLKNIALDNAKSRLLEIAMELYGRSENPALVADVRVIREEKSWVVEKQRDIIPRYEVVVEAIGYKRREKN